MTPTQILQEMLDANTVRVSCDKLAFESLRTQLVKRWQKYKREYDAIGMLADSKRIFVCAAKWDKESSVGTFSLRETTRKEAQFEVIGVQKNEN